MTTVLRALAIAVLLVAPISTESAGAKSKHVIQIQTMLARWQTRLGLGDWRIQAQIVPPGSLGAGEDGIPTVANIVYHTDRRSAAICVERTTHHEVEQALLHELIHLKLEAWQPPVSPDDEEQTVDTIAFALLGPKTGE